MKVWDAYFTGDFEDKGQMNNFREGLLCNFNEWERWAQLPRGR